MGQTNNSSSSDASESPRGHAVVVGAGMAGLVFARVLSEYADRVSLLDHDDLPEGPEFRRGAGQMSHTHILLDRGREIYEQLFPGIVEERSGAKGGPVDHGSEFPWHQFGTWKPTPETGMDLWPVDRTQLEWAVRKRVREISNVEVVANRKVVDFLVSEGRPALEGVEVRNGEGELEQWRSELVVDAMGRGTRTPRLLEKYGFGEPPTNSYDPGVSYTTCEVSEPVGFERDWKGILIMPDSFEATQMGTIYRLDEERFRVTQGGWSGTRAPTSESGLREFARDLPSPELARALDHTDFLSDPRRYEVRQGDFRRYDKMDDRPDGLLVVGDAFCTFNPIYAQGMTVAAREADVLRKLLDEREAGERIVDPSIWQTYYERAASIAAEAWTLSTSLDFQFAGVEGNQLLPKVVAPFVNTLQQSAGENSDVYRAFIRLMHMQAEPTVLLKPNVLFPLLGKGVRKMVGLDS